MKKRLALTIALAGLASGARAADLRGPIIETPPAYGVLPAPAFSWTGGYAGVNIGFGGGHSSYGYDVASTGYTDNNGGGGKWGGGGWGGKGTDCGCDYDGGGGYYDNGGNNYYNGAAAGNSKGYEKMRSSGVLGGVQVGYNYALGGIGGFGAGGGFGGGGFGGFGGFLPVIGVEADFDGSGIGSGGALGGFAGGAYSGYGNYVGVQSDIKYFGTVRGRLGVAFDRLLVYGTGGFAYADVDSSVVSPAYNVSAHSSNFHTGIAYGGGFEFALTNNLLLRAEYLHLDLNRKAIVANGGDAYTTYTVTEKPSIDLVRAGLSYKFDFARAVAPPPVIARY